MKSRTYAVGQSSITLRFGDITESRAEVLVSSDDMMLSMGGGVSAALRAAGGPRVPADASKMAPAKVGDVVVSTAGDLPAKYVFHAITLGEKPHEMSPDAIVRQTTRSAMRLLSALNCKSIAFPAIGAGLAGIPLEVVAAEMATELVGFFLDSETSYEVELYLKHRFPNMSDNDFFVFVEQFAVRQLGLVNHAASEGHVMAAPTGTEPGMNPDQVSEVHRRHEVYKMLRHLDAQRNRIEAALLQVQVLTDKDTSDAARLAILKSQLEQIQALRRNYEMEVAPLTTGGLRVTPRSVFVSSTSVDLKEHRKAARQAIEGLQFVFVGMEDFEAVRTAPAELIRQKVCECESYVGILGMRYGYVDDSTNLSMTEIEYHQAVASAKPIQMFVMDKDAPITAGMIETDPKCFASLVKFKERVLKDHTCRFFSGPQDLATKVSDTLSKQAG